MVKNMGSADRIIRAILGIGGLVLGIVLGGLWWIAAVLGVVFLLTSAVSFCPLYAPFKLSTRRKED
jgi:hypothetical protein